MKLKTWKVLRVVGRGDIEVEAIQCRLVEGALVFYNDNEAEPVLILSADSEWVKVTQEIR